MSDLTPCDIFITLFNKNLIEKHRYPNWWPDYGKQEVVITTILTQQARFTQVEKSMSLLRNANIATIAGLATADLEEIRHNIRLSGFYNQKSQRLKYLCQNIIDSFGNFETFKKNVTRHWLLSQNGIGFESADSILCYACEKPVMVSDAYTKRLLTMLGFTFETYEQINDWLYAGTVSEICTIRKITDTNLRDESVFALFHGLIVEFMKDKPKREAF